MMHQMLIANLRAALQGEQEAMAFYTVLARKAPHDLERFTILGIRRDETAHAITLAKWLTRLTGHMHTVMDLPEPTISSFRCGVEDAIKDETKDYVKYGEIANQALCVNPELYFDLKNIQKDEKYHRELFQLMK